MLGDGFGPETDRRTLSEQVGWPIGAETFARLGLYATLLTRWQGAKNLVGPETLDALWSRHIGDSLQVLPLLVAWTRSRAMKAGSPTGGGEPLSVLDLGSGAGLPGVPLAIAGLWDAPDGPGLGIRLQCVEANSRKGAFLRTVSRETQTPFIVHTSRIEDLAPQDTGPIDIVTARALAPLSRLVELAGPWLELGACAFFHKGGEYSAELASLGNLARYTVVEHESRIDSRSRILQISMATAG